MLTVTCDKCDRRIVVHIDYATATTASLRFDTGSYSQGWHFCDSCKKLLAAQREQEVRRRQYELLRKEFDPSLTKE